MSETHVDGISDAEVERFEKFMGTLNQFKTFSRQPNEISEHQWLCHLENFTDAVREAVATAAPSPEREGLAHELIAARDSRRRLVSVVQWGRKAANDGAGYWGKWQSLKRRVNDLAKKLSKLSQSHKDDTGDLGIAYKYAADELQAATRPEGER